MNACAGRTEGPAEVRRAPALAEPQRGELPLAVEPPADAEPVVDPPVVLPVPMLPLLIDPEPMLPEPVPIVPVVPLPIEPDPDVPELIEPDPEVPVVSVPIVPEPMLPVEPMLPDDVEVLPFDEALPLVERPPRRERLVLRGVVVELEVPLCIDPSVEPMLPDWPPMVEPVLLPVVPVPPLVCAEAKAGIANAAAAIVIMMRINLLL